MNIPFFKNKVEGVETPFRRSASGEMRAALKGQKTVISALASYKKWKIDNGYTGEHDNFDKLREKYAKHDPVNVLIIAILSANRSD